MADITKCKDSKCPAKEKCYRYTSMSIGIQEYFTESPRLGNYCDLFWGDAQQGIYNYLDAICKGEKK